MCIPDSVCQPTWGSEADGPEEASSFGWSHVLLSLAQGLLEKECDLGYHCLVQSLAGSHPRRT